MSDFRCIKSKYPTPIPATRAAADFLTDPRRIASKCPDRGTGIYLRSLDQRLDRRYPVQRSTGSASAAPAAMFDKVLRLLSQPAAPHRRACARQPRLGASRRQPGSLGKGDREAPGRLDAAARPAAARRGHLSCGGERAGGRDRSRLGGEAESRPDQRGPSPQSHRIQQRDPRSVRARRRREAAAARATRPPTAASTTSPTPCRSRRRTSSATCRWRGRSRGSRPACLRPRPAVETFEIPLHVVQDDRQSEDLPFGSRGGMAIRYDFPVDGEYAIKVRLQRQYQDYIKGMGWPQQLDVRLDGKLLKRFTVGGEATGPAGRSQLRRRRRAGICRRRLRGKSTCRSAATRAGGPRPGRGRPARRRRLVRAGAVGAGRPAAAAAARAASSPTIRCTWTTRASARFRSAVRIR